MSSAGGKRAMPNSGPSSYPASSSSSSSSKRVRITSPSLQVTASSSNEAGFEDQGLGVDVELEEQDSKRNAQGRKGRLITDGYGSEEDVDSDLEEGEGVDDEDEDEDDGKAGESEGLGARKSALKRQGKEKGSDEDEDENDDDDDDMFDIGSEDDGKKKGKGKAKGQGQGQGKGKSKGKQNLSMGDIEGQEFGTGDAALYDDDSDMDPDLELEESESESESGSEDVDGPSASASERTPPTSPRGTPLSTSRSRSKKIEKKKKGMGFKLDAFNMKNEMSRGKFDEEGNYIAKATDPHAEHDEWLKGNYSRGAIARAKEAQAKRMKEQEASVGLGDGEEQIGKDLVDCRMKLAAFLQKGESVLEALGRLGKLAKSAKRSNTNTRRASKAFDSTPSNSATHNGNASDSISSTAQDNARKEVEMISSLSNALMARYGVINIYEETYEEMLRHVKRSQRVSQDWDPARDRAREAQVSSMDVADAFDSSRSDSDKFIYKWSASYLSEVEGSHSQSDIDSHVSSKEQETFGPFALKELRSWEQGGYFGAGGERIVLRRAGSDTATNEEQAWKSWSEVVG